MTKVSGIYKIKTPNGSVYVGSSINVTHRWQEHRWLLKKGKHHSSRLQAAYAKHGDALEFSVIEECDREKFNEREQFYVDSLCASLNMAVIIKNRFSDPQTLAKYRATISSQEHKKMRSEISTRRRISWKTIHCSDGSVFDNLSTAARAYGIRPGSIHGLASRQTVVVGLGVRFRFEGDDWLPLETRRQKEMKTRLANGTVKPTAETRKRMSAANPGVGPPEWGRQRGIASRRRPVVGTPVGGGASVYFSSIAEAARALRPERWKSAQTFICSACSGREPMAYGFLWSHSAKSAAAKQAASTSDQMEFARAN